MHDDDPALNDTEASAIGILQCLRMLADEAADLRLAGTLRALREAIAVCQTERTATPEPATTQGSPTLGSPTLGSPERSRLH